MSDLPGLRSLASAVARAQRWWTARREDDGAADSPAPQAGPSPRPAARGQRGRIVPDDVGPITLESIDHLEWYVGNAGHTAVWLERLGLRVVARQGPETGVQDIVSLVLEAGAARLLLTTGLTPNHDATRSIAARGDAVLDVAFRIRDVEAAYGRLIHSGLEPDHLPVEMHGDGVGLSLVPVTTADEVLHTLLARGDDPAAGFAPGFVPVDAGPGVADDWISGISSVTTVVTPGRLDEVVAQYRRLFRLEEVGRAQHEDGVELVVLAHPEVIEDAEPRRVAVGALRLVFVGPTRRAERNHVDDFLSRHGGPGVRSVTLATAAFDDALEGWRRAGVALLTDGDEQAADAGARRALTEPLQARSPLVLALEEVTDRPVDPVALARAEEDALAAYRRSHPDAPPLGTWAGGR